MEKKGIKQKDKTGIQLENGWTCDAGMSLTDVPKFCMPCWNLLPAEGVQKLTVAKQSDYAQVVVLSAMTQLVKAPKTR